MADHLAGYTLDDGTVVCFEVDPPPGYRPAGAADVVAQVRAAVAPALAPVQAVVEQARDAAPDEVEVNWWIAKAATEGNQGVILTWNRGSVEG